MLENFTKHWFKFFFIFYFFILVFLCIHIQSYVGQLHLKTLVQIFLNFLFLYFYIYRPSGAFYKQEFINCEKKQRNLLI